MNRKKSKRTIPLHQNETINQKYNQNMTANLSVRTLLFAFTLLFMGLTAGAQVMPVQTQVMITPPYSARLSDYASGSSSTASFIFNKSSYWPWAKNSISTSIPVLSSIYLWSGLFAKPSFGTA